MSHSATTGSKGTILIGEDEPEVRNYLSMALNCHGYDVAVADDGSEVVNFLRTSDSGVSALLLDILMPRMNGIEAVREIRKNHATLPIIMISGVTKPETIIEVMKCGATDYLTKPITHDQLCQALKSALQSSWNSESVESCDKSFEDPAGLRDVGWARESEAMVRLVGAADVPVLILGETGSGKEVLARRLHANSPRAQKPFLKLNCAALPSELVESELFGYDRGAFTGAFQKKAGMFELADGGTLLLDEIGDMDCKLQAKLLQVLQDQTFQHLGGKETVSVNVRVIAATHRDLEQAIAAGDFREDLYYRLNVIAIRVPPLRERRSEVIPLAEHFLAKHNVGESSERVTLTPALKRALADFPWPGNVRQLENMMRRHLVLRDPDAMIAELHRQTAHAAAKLLKPAATVGAARAGGAESVLQQVNDAKEVVESQAIMGALDAAHWNRKQAAKMLGVDYKALLYRMKKLSIDGNGDGDHSSVGTAKTVDGRQPSNGAARTA
jgi:two-component system, NtrC family, response regulator AtoC